MSSASDQRHAHPRAAASHPSKREKAHQLGVDEAIVSQMVETFYASVRQDDLLAPIFDSRISDWPTHLDRMKAFWRSVLLNTGEFSGNPMLKHIAIPGLEARHFARWLELFYAALGTLGVDRDGELLVAERARAIADSLLIGIATRRSGLAGAKAGKDLPYA